MRKRESGNRMVCDICGALPGEPCRSHRKAGATDTPAPPWVQHVRFMPEGQSWIPPVVKRKTVAREPKLLRAHDLIGRIPFSSPE